MSSRTVPIPPDLNPACRAGTTVRCTVPREPPGTVGEARTRLDLGAVALQYEPAIGVGDRISPGATPPGRTDEQGDGMDHQ